MRRAAKVDGNQSDIVADLRAIPNCSVQILSAVGQGCPDLLIGYRGFNFLVELKDPSKPKSDRQLTPDQVEWHAEWHGQVLKAETFLEIIQAMTGYEFAG